VRAVSFCGVIGFGSGLKITKIKFFNRGIYTKSHAENAFQFQFQTSLFSPLSSANHPEAVLFSKTKDYEE